VSKSWIACALGHKACRDDGSVPYQRLPRLFEALALARGDGRHEEAITRLVGAILLEQNDEWAVRRARYMMLETIAR
jgi:DNA replication protein DnaC